MNQAKTASSRPSNSLVSLRQVMERLRSMGDSKALEGMSRFGIATAKAYGVSVPELRALAREVGRDHQIALSLWDTGIHEARILAGMVDDPQKVTEDQMESWAREFDSWDLVDGSCGNLFDKTPLAVDKAMEWSRRKEE